jgi:hypothetical protein
MISVSYVDHSAFAMTSLRRCPANATLQPMYTVARFLQMVGLTIPLLAIFAQLNQSITAGKMLGFLVASVLIFSIGYLLQRSLGGRG